MKTDDIEGLVHDLKGMGLRGIEAYYPAHSDADVEKYLSIAKGNDLIVTAGSDYHGKMRAYAAIACEKRSGPQLTDSIKFLLEKYAI